MPSSKLKSQFVTASCGLFFNLQWKNKLLEIACEYVDITHQHDCMHYPANDRFLDDIYIYFINEDSAIHGRKRQKAAGGGTTTAEHPTARGEAGPLAS
jgi:hypothetical protein